MRTFAPRASVVGLSITNEANLPGSPNTSDGFYTGVRSALVQGVIAARAEADRLGRPDLRTGFSYAYRSAPASDDQFFEDLGREGGAAFAAAVDEVGLQVYPGLFWPPATTDPAGDTIEALTLLRDCWLPKAGLGRDVALTITENGYATRGGTGEEGQAAPSLRVTVRPRRVMRRRSVVLRVRVRAAGRAVRGAVVRVGSRRVLTGRRGRARLRFRFVGRPGLRRVRVRAPGFSAAGAGIRVVARGA